MYLVRLHYGGSTRVKSGKGIITARCTLVQTAKRGIAIAYRLSVCLSVTMVDCDHIGWNSSKIISALVSLGCSIANAAEWLQIAQRPQWRAYRKLPSLFLMVPSVTLYNLSFAPKWGFHMPPTYANGHISPSGSRVGFSETADRTALFTIRTNPTWRPPPCWNNFKWRYLRNRSSDPLHVLF